ncbi:calcium-binding protein [Ensifer sp. Root278]|uniref:calcium-binding protein n=1 Tax=Ensifer sp. Root278 TaxID=1736509 RepID=UPI00070EF980|nr:calcium-binding protein [Ensifer sp. Root278]KRD53277.1 hypothetical protein ASE60_12675 [Ensifer sp. Root278]
MAKIVGTDANDTLFGTDENDNIWGLGANDTLDGGLGNDFLYGGAGNDGLVSFSGYDELDGGDGDDRLELNGTGGVARGGAGIDTLVINLSGTGNRVTFNGMNRHVTFGDPAETDNHIFYRGIERLELTTGSGKDIVEGGTGDDVISTGDGADIIGGQSLPNTHNQMSSLGADVIDAGAGNDTIIDRFGANHLSGGSGDDSITTTLSSAKLDGGDGDDTLRFEDADRTDDVTVDVVNGVTSTGTAFHNFERVYAHTGSGNDTLLGGLSRDNLFGGNGADRLIGGENNDYLYGEGDDDRLEGGAGVDSLSGGEGDDHLSGGDGADRLIGGEGADTFHWSGFEVRHSSIDHIVDFDTQSGDVIELGGFYPGDTNIYNFDSFVAASHDTEEGLYVAFHGETEGILIEGVSLADLSADDIAFTL